MVLSVHSHSKTYCFSVDRVGVVFDGGSDTFYDCLVDKDSLGLAKAAKSAHDAAYTTYLERRVALLPDSYGLVDHNGVEEFCVFVSVNEDL
jgi:hypothetical protein